MRVSTVIHSWLFPEVVSKSHTRKVICEVETLPIMSQTADVGQSAMRYNAQPRPTFDFEYVAIDRGKGLFRLTFNVGGSWD